MQTLGDLVSEATITGADRLPTLEMRDIVDQDQIEGMLRLARAELARLVLERTRVRHDLDGIGGGRPSVDLCASRELLRSSLELRLQARRDELADELRRARADAAATVANAQAEARALLAEAGDALVELLTPRLEPVEETAPADAAFEEPPPVDVASDEMSPVEAPSPPTRAHPVQAVDNVPVAAPPAPAPPTPAANPFWSRYLYADVVLPLIAVVIVIILLLAWVG